MSLGGKQTTTKKIDPALEAQAKQNLDMARQVGQLGFVPYTGATVAGLQPDQIAAIQNTNAGLSAFGLGTAPVPQGGDLSPYATYQAALAQMAPGQRKFIESMFINPMTGAAPKRTFEPKKPPPAAPKAEEKKSKKSGRSNALAAGRRATESSGPRYISLRDMVDGGGAGKPGSSFSGGPLSGALNRRGVRPVAARPSTPIGKGR
jgi:hypothetical protein